MNTCKHCDCNSDYFGCFCQDHSAKLDKMLSPEQLESSRNFTSTMMARLEAIEKQPDFVKLWAGRPKSRRIRYTKYYFIFDGCYRYVSSSPLRYIPVNWHGLV